MIKVVCIDETEGDDSHRNHITNGKIYEAYTADDFADRPYHIGSLTPEDCYFIVADDGHGIMPLKIYFEPLREKNLKELL
jgi:hypothetical protein